jgi:L-lactate dehydrogenase (cytochrome)
LSFASLDRWPGTVAEYLDTMFDPTVTFEDLAWIKSQWPNRLVVKGIQTVDDARAVADLGVDGLVLSNHGGRQLDRAPVPFHLLPAVAREVGGSCEVCWTPASCRAPTSSPPSHSAPGSRWSGAPTSMG